MQFLQFLTLVSFSIGGAIASPGFYTTPSPVTSISSWCSTSTYYSTICSSATPSASPTVPATVNQQNVCKSGSPFCCALSSSNNVNDGGHACGPMDNSTVNCDSTVICCNDNGSGTQICTNDLTIVLDLGSLLNGGQ